MRQVLTGNRNEAAARGELAARAVAAFPGKSQRGTIEGVGECRHGPESKTEAASQGKGYHDGLI